MPPIQAAFKGSKEIYFAVISTTITLAAVFLPIVFMGGISGQLFKRICHRCLRICIGFGIRCPNAYAYA